MKKEFDAVRAKFGVPTPAAGAAGWRWWRRAWRRWRSGAKAPTSSARVGTMKTLMLAFQDNPSDTLMKELQRCEARAAEGDQRRQRVPDEGDDAQPGAEEDNLTLTVPAPVK